MPRDPASHAARGCLLAALSALSRKDPARALALADEAARALREMLAGDHDTEAEVRRVMAEPMARRGAEHVSKPVARVMRGLASKVEGH